jgi:hypothetical protein
MSPNLLYDSIALWLNTFAPFMHAATSRSLTLSVFCVLLAQSLRPADRARSVPPQHPGSARGHLQRNRRMLDKPALSPSILTPLLVRTALWLLKAAGEAVPILIDTTRVGHWEVFYAALPFMGRTLPIAWFVIPYPWPKKAFRKTVKDLLDLINQSWPADRVPTVVADRGFPSQALFQHCHQLGWNWSVRLRCSSPVIYQGQKVRADLFIGQVPDGQWRCFPVTYYAQYSCAGSNERAYPVSGYLVVGHQEAELPPHKRGPATLAAIQKQRQAREQRAHHKRVQRGENPPTSAVQIASSYWLLFTSLPQPTRAVAVYRLRMLIEQTFRDWKSGWNLVPAVLQLSNLSHVSSLMGLTLLSYRLQMEIGVLVNETTEPIEARRRQQWTVSGRMSLFWQAAQALRDTVHYWLPSIASKLEQNCRGGRHLGVPSSLAA